MSPQSDMKCVVHSKILESASCLARLEYSEKSEYSRYSQQTAVMQKTFKYTYKNQQSNKANKLSLVFKEAMLIYT